MNLFIKQPAVRVVVVMMLLLAGLAVAADSPPQQVTYDVKRNIFYLDVPRGQVGELEQSMCVLDISYPANLKGYPTVVWFHGGGLTAGEKYFPKQLLEKKLAVVAVRYRLIPKGDYNDCLNDAAAAVAWVTKHIEEFGGDPEKIYVSGHSAGGYLAAMVGLDRSLLAKHGTSPDKLAGIIPMSGQMTTHFQICKDKGYPGTHPVLDEQAPMWHVRKDAPPILLITGDREKDFPGRVEENLLMARLLKHAGHPDVAMYELQGYPHNMESGGIPLLLRWIRSRADK